MENSELLAFVADEMRATLRGMSHDAVHSLMTSMEDYHGFGKCRFKDIVLPTITKHYEPVQVELVRVNTDLSPQVHYHEHTHAHVVWLGEVEHLPNPIKASVLPGRTRCGAGSTFDIPPGMMHGFSVRPGGILYFLSVQTPPIVGEGYEDYHLPTRH